MDEGCADGDGGYTAIGRRKDERVHNGSYWSYVETRRHGTRRTRLRTRSFLFMATIRQRDPTMTTGVRGQYAKEIARRFRRVRRLVLESVVENDALRVGKVPGIRVSGGAGFDTPAKIGQATQPAVNARAAGRYDFPSDVAGKAAAFMEWLREAIEDEILGITQGDVRKVVAREAWQDVYVRAAYGKGVATADAALKRMGIDVPDLSISGLFNLPIHADTLAMLFTRNFEELRDISETMASQISRILSEGLATGKGPREIGRLMGDLIEGMSRTRGTKISRTEIVRAWNEAAINRYEEFGIPGVTAMVELATAGDDRVCAECAGLQGRVYTLADARGVIPVHPNCLPGDALVSSCGGIAGASKRWFDGNLVIIRTASGQQLSSTPNHPVLTERGWVPAHLLNVGDYVVRNGRGDGKLFGNDEAQDVPARIEDVAETFFRAREVTEIKQSPSMFHGDGMEGGTIRFSYSSAYYKWHEPTVHLKRDERHLSTRAQRGQETFFQMLPGYRKGSIDQHRGYGLTSNQSALLELQERVLSSGGLFQAVCDDCADTIRALSYGDALQLPQTPIAPALAVDGFSRGEFAYIDDLPQVQAVSRLRSLGAVVHNTRRTVPCFCTLQGGFDIQNIFPYLKNNTAIGNNQEKGGIDLFNDAQLATNILDGAFGDVSLDNVVNIEMRDFSGHVYNLETEAGFYIANGVVTHNCRCAWLPVIPNLSVNQVRAIFNGIIIPFAGRGHRAVQQQRHR